VGNPTTPALVAVAILALMNKLSSQRSIRVERAKSMFDQRKLPDAHASVLSAVHSTHFHSVPIRIDITIRQVPK